MSTQNYMDWYNENEQRGYPLAETASRISDNGQKLPDNLIVDLSLSVLDSQVPVYLGGVYITSKIVSLYIVDKNAVTLYTATFVKGSLQPYKAYAIQVLNLAAAEYQISGWIVFGSYIQQATPVNETYLFSTSGQSELETKVMSIHKALPVTSIYTRSDLFKLANGGVLAGRNDTGILKLVPSTNVTLRRDGTNLSKIWVGLTPDSQVGFSSPCKGGTDANKCKLPPIKSINGVKPGPTGIIQINFIGA